MITIITISITVMIIIVNDHDRSVHFWTRLRTIMNYYVDNSVAIVTTIIITIIIRTITIIILNVVS